MLTRSKLANTGYGLTLVGCLLLCVGSTVAGCGSTPLPTYDYAQEPDPRAKEFVVGIADGLRINVWKNPQLSAQVSVRPDGTITLPLIGDLKASGQTPSQLRKQIATRLQDYIRSEAAIVTVEVTQVNSYRFTVSGEVQRSGVYTARQFLTVQEALLLAGGFSRFAKTAEIQLVRCCDAAGKERRIPISFPAIRDGNSAMNIVVLSGDKIYVP